MIITVTGDGRRHLRSHLATRFGVDSRCAAAGAGCSADGCREKGAQRPQIPRNVAHAEDLHAAKLSTGWYL